MRGALRFSILKTTLANFGQRAVWPTLALLVCVFSNFAASAVPGDTNSPLYLLTYDHGGVILWGPEHFAERLRNAMTWLDRYPGFKLGLDNEAYVYDYLAIHEPALLEELRGDLKKYAGRFGIACRAQEKLERVAFRIDRSVEVRPHFLDFDVGFIHAPGVIARFEVRSRALLQLWGVVLYPTINGGMIHV